MAPPRRSTARIGSATPAGINSPLQRTTRSSSKAPSDTGSSRYSLRANATKGPSDVAVTNPQLPEVQTQQSFAYGSQKTPLLPEKLVARGPMTLEQMAETIDIGIRQAQRNFQDQAEEAEENLRRANQIEARDDRARRRSESREGSVDSQDTDDRTRRTAAWADSQANSLQLEEIQEESEFEFEDESIQNESTEGEEPTRDGTDGPSSFPSGNFDISYNQERGIFRPLRPLRPTLPGESIPRRIYTFIWNFLHLQYQISTFMLTEPPRRGFASIREFFRSWGNLVGDSVGEVASPRPAALLRSLVITGWTLGLTSVTLIAASLVTCMFWSNWLCEFGPTPSIVYQGMQRYCGACLAKAHMPSQWNLGDVGGSDFLTSRLNQLSQRIDELSSHAENKEAELSAALDRVIRRQQGIEASILDLKQLQTTNVGQQAVAEKINYAAVGNGAVIDPYLTSPTKQKRYTLVQSVFIWATGLQKYQSHPPSEALRPWDEVGECWCSAPAKGHAQLAVLLAQEIYPTEVVIEHVPITSSAAPGTAPKDIEIWADFSHVGAHEFVDAGLDRLPRSESLPRFTRIGKVRYDATGAARNVQAFRLDVNQGSMKHATHKMVFRAVTNYGAGHTCFYRVRVHGEPVVPHPKIKIDGQEV